MWVLIEIGLSWARGLNRRFREMGQLRVHLAAARTF